MLQSTSRTFGWKKRGEARALTPRAFDVLVYLIEQRGRVVEKQELFDQIWKETFVTDSALAREIKEIRHALEDDAAAPRYIETVPKRGYRFIAKLRESEIPAPQANVLSLAGPANGSIWNSGGRSETWSSRTDRCPQGFESGRPCGL